MRFSLGLARKRTGLVAAILTLGIAASASAALFFVYPPSSWPLLQPYSAHAANWWKWVLAQPADKSPLLDTTGVNCGQGQSSSVLAPFYLVGAPSNDPVMRSCTIPANRTLLFPVMNAAYFALTTDPADQRTESFVRAQNTWIENATNLEVDIDGVSVPNIKSYLEKSSLFSVTLPANNIYGLDAGFVLDPAADEGYYLALAPLLAGKHTIHFHGEATDPYGNHYVQDVTYNLTVKLF